MYHEYNEDHSQKETYYYPPMERDEITHILYRIAEPVLSGKLQKIILLNNLFPSKGGDHSIPRDKTVHKTLGGPKKWNSRDLPAALNQFAAGIGCNLKQPSRIRSYREITLSQNLQIAERRYTVLEFYDLEIVKRRIRSLDDPHYRHTEVSITRTKPISPQRSLLEKLHEFFYKLGIILPT